MNNPIVKIYVYALALLPIFVVFEIAITGSSRNILGGVIGGFMAYRIITGVQKGAIGRLREAGWFYLVLFLISLVVLFFLIQDFEPLVLMLMGLISLFLAFGVYTLLVSKSTASEAMKVNADHLSDEYNNRKLDNVIEGIEIHKSPSYYWVGDKYFETIKEVEEYAFDNADASRLTK